mgnify:CR=1 FL=1
MDFDFDGQFGRVKSLGEQRIRTSYKECHCYINDTYEQIAARWGKTPQQRYAEQRAKNAEKKD